MALAPEDGGEAQSDGPSAERVALHNHGRRKRPANGRTSMSESSSHAPGHEISGEGGAVRQRHRMGEGDGPMNGGSFGVGSLPGTAVAQNHGKGRDDGKTLSDNERAGPPMLDQGKGRMSATAHSYHGDHDSM